MTTRKMNPNKGEIPFDLPVRDAEGYKGTFGKLLIISGGEEMCGAAILAAKAAFRSGVGMVRIITAYCNRSTILSAVPEALVACYDPEELAKGTVSYLDRFLDPYFKWADAVVIGPGIGRGREALELFSSALEHIDLPLVIDGDALFFLAENERCQNALLGSKERQVILTPHIGELNRLIQSVPGATTGDYVHYTRCVSEYYGCVVVGKSHKTAIAYEPTQEFYLNETGCSALATAGSGDVLAGLIGTFLIQYKDPFMAACSGAWVHGVAGAAGSGIFGDRGLIAGDLPELIAKLLRKIDFAKGETDESM